MFCYPYRSFKFGVFEGIIVVQTHTCRYSDVELVDSSVASTPSGASPYCPLDTPSVLLVLFIHTLDTTVNGPI